MAMRLALLAESLALAVIAASAIPAVVAFFPDALAPLKPLLHIEWSVASLPAGIHAVVDAIQLQASTALFILAGLVSTAMAIVAVRANSALHLQQNLERRIAALATAADTGELPPLPPNQELQELIDAASALDKEVDTESSIYAQHGSPDLDDRAASDRRSERDFLIEEYIEKDLERRIETLRAEHKAAIGSGRHIEIAESVVGFFARNELLSTLRSLSAVAFICLGYVFIGTTVLLIGVGTEASDLANSLRIVQPQIAARSMAKGSNSEIKSRRMAVGISPPGTTSQGGPLVSLGANRLTWEERSFATKMHLLDEEKRRLAAASERLAEEKYRVVAKSKYLEQEARRLAAKSARLEALEQSSVSKQLDLRRKTEEERRLAAETNRQRRDELARAEYRRQQHQKKLAADAGRFRQLQQSLEARAVQLRHREEVLKSATSALQRSVNEQRGIKAEAEKRYRDEEAHLSLAAERLAKMKLKLSAQTAESQKKAAQLATKAEQIVKARNELRDAELVAKKSAAERARAAAQAKRRKTSDQARVSAEAERRLSTQAARLRREELLLAAKSDALEKERLRLATLNGREFAGAGTKLSPLSKVQNLRNSRDLLIKARKRCEVTEADRMLRHANGGAVGLLSVIRRGSVRGESGTRSMARRFVECGQVLMFTGNVLDARSLFVRAANAGLIEGAMALGTTFDPVALTKVGLPTSFANPEMARSWYRKALAVSRD